MFRAKVRESFLQHQEGRDVPPDLRRCQLPLCNTQKLPLRPFPRVSARKAEIKQVPAAGARGVTPKCCIPQEWLQGWSRNAFACFPVRGPHLSHVADSIQASIPAPQPRLLQHARTLATARKGGNDLCKVGRGGCRVPGTSGMRCRSDILTLRHPNRGNGCQPRCPINPLLARGPARSMTLTLSQRLWGFPPGTLIQAGFWGWGHQTAPSPAGTKRSPWMLLLGDLLILPYHQPFGSTVAPGWSSAARFSQGSTTLQPSAAGEGCAVPGPPWEAPAPAPPRKQLLEHTQNLPELPQTVYLHCKGSRAFLRVCFFGCF